MWWFRLCRLSSAPVPSVSVSSSSSAEGEGNQGRGKPHTAQQRSFLFKCPTEADCSLLATAYRLSPSKEPLLSFLFSPLPLQKALKRKSSFILQPFTAPQHGAWRSLLPKTHTFPVSSFFFYSNSYCISFVFFFHRASAKEEWKFAHSTSQQTWLSSEDGQAGGKLEAVSQRAG